MEFSPLKPSVLEHTDMIIFRELTQGIYFGEKGRSQNGKEAFDTCTYTADNIRAITHLAFNAAMERKKKLTLVDKANVLETSRLWREEVQQIAKSFPEVSVEYCYVDNAAMKLVLNPSSFDVVLTENMFGDILTDEAAVLSGSLGLLPSASVGSKGMLFEPIHGSYPQAKGKGIANPIGAILSAAMMLEMVFEMEIEATVIRKSVSDAIKNGVLTMELSKGKSYTTSEVGSQIAETITSEVFEYL
jgi:3-isopropylmalate dehydrogenase